MKWLLDGPMAAFDVESTGVSVEEDRIVTATVVSLMPAAGAAWAVEPKSWLINPGVDIPEQATAVHGITTLHAKEHGEEPAEALSDIAHELARAFAAKMPVIGHNVSYDCTILDRELRRHGLPAVDERLGRPIAPVVDVYVLDKAVDPWRKGKRKLTDLCEHYGVRIDGAHDAVFDAMAAARVAYQIARLAFSTPASRAAVPDGRRFMALERMKEPRVASAYTDLAGMRPQDLHDAQVVWRAEQQESLAAYFAQQGKPFDGDGHWPCKPFLTTEEPS